MVCEALGLTQPRLSQLIQNKALPANGTLDEYLAANEARMARAQEDLDLTEQRARLAKAQADAKEMENSVRRGELLERGPVQDLWIDEAQRVKARLLSMPTKLAPLVIGCKVAEAEHAIRKEINEALAELADDAPTS